MESEIASYVIATWIEKGLWEKKPNTRNDNEWIELDEKALSVVQLCLCKNVLQEVLSEKSTTRLWFKLENLYLTKYLINQLI